MPVKKDTVFIVAIAISVSISSIVLLLLVRRDFTITDNPANQTRPKYSDNIEASSEQKSSNATRDGVLVTVEGLKNRYPPSEELYFTVAARGHGIFCPKPIATIVKQETGETVWIISRGAVCQQMSPQDFDKTWTLFDLRDEAFPLLVGQLFGSGQYKLVVEYDGATVEQNFIQE